MGPVMVQNTMRETMAAGEPSLGAWISTMSARSAEVLATTDLEWAVIDMEHTPINERGVEAILRAFTGADMTPLVRIPALDHGIRGVCKRVLDSGAMGIIVPRVESRADAEAAVEAAAFPPDGERGVGGRIRANRHGADFEDYVGSANDEILVVAQLETKRGAERAESICETPGLDAVFIGENDLSATHGHPGEKDLPAVQADVDAILAAAEAAGLYAGIVAPDPDRIVRRIEAGIDFISIGSDLSLIDRAAAGTVEAVRERR